MTRLNRAKILIAGLVLVGTTLAAQQRSALEAVLEVLVQRNEELDRGGYVRSAMGHIETAAARTNQNSVLLSSREANADVITLNTEIAIQQFERALGEFERAQAASYIVDENAELVLSHLPLTVVRERLEDEGLSNLVMSWIASEISYLGNALAAWLQEPNPYQFTRIQERTNNLLELFSVLTLVRE